MKTKPSKHHPQTLPAARLLKTLAVAAALGLAHQAFAETVTTTTLVPGLVYKKITYDSLAGGPQRVYIIDVDLKNPALEFKMPHLNGGSLRTLSQHATVTIDGGVAAINTQMFTSGTGIISYLRVGGNFVCSTTTGYDSEAIVDNDAGTRSSVAIVPRPAADWSSLSYSSIMAVGPNLVKEGVKRTDYNMDDPFITAHDPRTAVAYTYNNHMFLVVVDGRTSVATGMTIPGLRDYVDSLDSRYGMGEVYNAANCDGGGSSELWTSSGGVENSPSDGHERPIADALVVGYYPEMHIFARQTSDNSIIKKQWTRLNSWDASWSSLSAPAGGAASDPSSISRAYRSLDVFVRGTDGLVYNKNYSGNGSGWASSWNSIGTGTITGSPDACSWASNRMDVVARSASNTLLHKSWNGTSWTAWEDLGGSITSDPSSASRSSNRIDVVARGSAGGLAHIAYSNSVWSAWETVAGTALLGGADACSSTTNKLQVFYRGTDNALKWITMNGSTWTGVTDLGGTLSADPSGTSYESGQLMVFARNSAGAVIKRNYDNSSWGGWSTELGGATTGGPDGASWSNATENR